MKTKLNLRPVAILCLHLVVVMFAAASCGQKKHDAAAPPVNQQDKWWQERLLSYRIGSEHGKIEVDFNNIASKSLTFQRVVKATANVAGGSTGIVLGEKNGQMIFATNHHILGTEEECLGIYGGVGFKLLKIDLHCAKILITNETLDVTLFTVKDLTEEDAAKLRLVATTFSKGLPKKGRKLITAGQGVIGIGRSNHITWSSGMKADDSDNCKIFSPDNEARLLPVSGLQDVWHFAIGCEASQGDSGSGIFDRDTGELLGILHSGQGGTKDRDPRVTDSAFISEIYDTSSEAVWKELTYGTPSSKIHELMGEFIP